MPEIGALNGYGARGETGYNPTAFHFGPAPVLTPNTTGASAILGGAKSLDIVSDTLAKLPDLVTAAYKKGQLQTEQNIAHQLKLGALAGGLTDDIKIGGDNSVTINPEDPYTKSLKQQAILAGINFKNSQANKNNNPILPGNGLFEDDPLPSNPTPQTNAPVGVLARPTGQTDGLGNPVETLPPGSSALGPLATPPGGMDAPPPMPDGTGALAQGVNDIKTPPQGALASPAASDVLPPLDENGITEDADLDKELRKPGVTTKKGNRALGIPWQAFDPQGNVIAYQMPGMKAPMRVARPLAAKPTADEAANKAAAVTTARELALRGHTPEQIAAMTDAEKQAELQKPKISAIRQPTAQQLSMVTKYGLDVDLTGKNADEAAAAIKQAMDKKGYELSPEQLKQYNTMVAQMARNPILKTAGTANIGYESVLAGAKQKNGFGDLAMVDGLLRLVNPSMGVTGHAADSVQQGIPTIQRYTGLALDRIFNGDRLTDEARDRIVALAKDLRERENAKRKTAIDAYLHEGQMNGLTQAQIERAEKDAVNMFAMEDPTPATPSAKPNGKSEIKAQLKAMLESGRDEDGRDLTDKEKAAIRMRLSLP